MNDTIGPINARQARRLTVRRAIAISYGTDGRYKERMFRYRNGTNYLDALLGGFNREAMKNAGFDPDAEPKAYAIPEDVPLFRWVLTDGTVVTSTTGFPQNDYVVLRTLDGRDMFVPVSNVDYVIELRG